MGGIGSGRRWRFDAKNTTEDYRSIDIRRWARDGLLKPDHHFNWRWSRHGEVVASIKVEVKPESVVLNYRHRSGSDDWTPKRYSVHLSETPCHMGGARKWFLCPARGCGRRVAILYGGAIFACRHCFHLAYPSQRETQGDRAARRADRIRDMLGWPGGILEGGGWGKPKGMHWRTYARLCREHDALSDRALQGFAEQLGQLNRHLERNRPST